MNKKTSIEVYFSLEKESDHDFSLSYITERLGIQPTRTHKIGDQINNSTHPHGKYSYTQWKYSTGRIETNDFEMMLKKVVHTFKDKIDIINKIRQELQLESRLCAVVYVENGDSPGYLIETEVMKFAIEIGAEIEIDDYISGFVEDDDEE